MKGALFRRLDTGSLYFTAEVLTRLHKHRQLGAGSREAGGLLLGRHLLDCEDVIVDDLTEPARSDRRTFTSFFRSIAHQTTAFSRWRRSGGVCAYLGSWHTHPQSDPTPSTVDLQDWNHALARDRFEGDQLFFVIVGTARLRVWQGDRAAGVAAAPLVPVAPREDTSTKQYETIDQGWSDGSRQRKRS